MENSNWEKCQQRSTYHFDPFAHTSQADRMRYVGRFVGDWKQELDQAVNNAVSITWRTRDMKDNPTGGPGIDGVENDLVKAGGKPDTEITSLEDDVASYPSFQKMTDALHLVDGADRPLQTRVHVQMPGQTWTAHVDQLNKWSMSEPLDNIFRFMIFLHDYEFGHFVQYGNEILTKYRAGEIYTWDHVNVPHCTANAGVTPRSTMVITGIGTQQTRDLFYQTNLEIEI